ncbi:hypothetical protein C8Q77DRAFT_1073960 [Trametes polyzona]|nr:hypothetical protein C8Q77DRAFT_1073960 [Trametes polyzona]
MLSRMNIIQFVPPPDPQAFEDRAPHLQAARDSLRTGLRSRFTGAVRTKSGRHKAQMSYSINHYAKRLVINSKLKIVNWPVSVPFRNLSKIKGGIWPLQELNRCWNHPDPLQRLRFVPSTAEDQANAARDPLSVHPNRQMYNIELAAAEAAAKAKARAVLVGPASDPPEAMSTPNTVAVQVGIHHPVDLGLLGTQPTSTQPQLMLGAAAGDAEEAQSRAQRRDMGGRRQRATDNDPRFKKRAKRGITSLRFVIPGDGDGEGQVDGEWPRKRVREDYAVEDSLHGIAWALADVQPSEASDIDEIESPDGDWPGRESSEEGDAGY